MSAQHTSAAGVRIEPTRGVLFSLVLYIYIGGFLFFSVCCTLHGFFRRFSSTVAVFDCVTPTTQTPRKGMGVRPLLSDVSSAGCEANEDSRPHEGRTDVSLCFVSADSGNQMSFLSRSKLGHFSGKTLNIGGKSKCIASLFSMSTVTVSDEHRGNVKSFLFSGYPAHWQSDEGTV